MPESFSGFCARRFGARAADWAAKIALRGLEHLRLKIKK